MKKENALIATFMGGIKGDVYIGDIKQRPQFWDIMDSKSPLAGHRYCDETLRYNKEWNWLMPVIRKINDIGKDTQFAIFKTYVSCTVEKHSKFHKGFSFSHAEYITPEQTDIQAAFKLVVKFVSWYNTTIAAKDLEKSN